MQIWRTRASIFPETIGFDMNAFISHLNSVYKFKPITTTIAAQIYRHCALKSMPKPENSPHTAAKPSSPHPAPLPKSPSCSPNQSQLAEQPPASVASGSPAPAPGPSQSASSCFASSPIQSNIPPSTKSRAPGMSSDSLTNPPIFGSHRACSNPSFLPRRLPLLRLYGPSSCHTTACSHSHRWRRRR